MSCISFYKSTIFIMSLSTLCSAVVVSFPEQDFLDEGSVMLIFIPANLLSMSPGYFLVISVVPSEHRPPQNVNFKIYLLTMQSNVIFYISELVVFINNKAEKRNSSFISPYLHCMYSKKNYHISNICAIIKFQ